MKCSLCSVQGAVFSVRCAVYNLQYTMCMCIVQFSTCSVQCPLYSLKRTVSLFPQWVISTLIWSNGWIGMVSAVSVHQLPVSSDLENSWEMEETRTTQQQLVTSRSELLQKIKTIWQIFLRFDKFFKEALSSKTAGVTTVSIKQLRRKRGKQRVANLPNLPNLKTF